MLYSSLAFLAGICVFQACTHLPGTGWLWLAACVPLSFFSTPLLRMAGLAAAGFVWVWWHAGQVTALQLPAALEGRDVLVRGVIQDLPERLVDQRVRFRLLIEQFSEHEHWQTLDLPTRITWYRDAEQVQAGERWQLLVRLKQPRGFANPGGFDHERWLFARAIRATGYVRDSDSNQRLAAAGRHTIHRLREQLSSRIRELDRPQALRALLRGLGVGDRSGMSAHQWQVLRKTGTSHLLAISGLHVGLVAGLAFFVARKSWSALGKPQIWPAPKVAALCAVCAALGYALLAGFQVPAQRALIMVAIWMLAILWTGRPDPWRVLSLALWVVLITDPLSVLSAGFWLSFGAVGLILWLTAGRYGQCGRVRQLTALQTGLVFGLTPLTWLWFQQVSLSAPAANLIAIPWIGFLVVPVLFAGLLCLPLLPALGDWLLGISADLLAVLWWLLEHLARLPVNLWQAPSVSGTWMAVLALGVLGVLLPRALSLLPVSILLLTTVFCLPAERPDNGNLWLSLLDVGQGLAVVVETHSHVLVYDTGPAFRSGFDTGEAVVAPFLVQAGHQQIDRLVISHADNDHIGGGESLFEYLDVLGIHSGEPARINWARATQCRYGQQWQWDGIRFAYLAPFAQARGNNSSCVLRIEAADGRVVLLPGDIERAIEQQLITQLPRQLAADILVAPHHGSLTSSTQAFVKAVDPQLVLFPVGYRNRFGFPRPEVVARYRAGGAQLLDTATSGAIQLRVEAGKPLRAVAYRRAWRRYWQAGS